MTSHFVVTSHFVMTSHQLHMRRDSACLQQRTDVARIAGQHDVRWSDQQCYVRVDDIGRASPREQLAYPLAVIPVQRFGPHARQYSCEIGLLAAITPDLTNNRGTRTQRRPLLLEHTQLSTNVPVAPVGSDQRSGIEYRLHLTSGRGARPSRDAAASSSASVKEPSSDSQASRAAPSSSLLSSADRIEHAVSQTCSLDSSGGRSQHCSPIWYQACSAVGR